MKNSLRILSLMLAILMLALTVASCGGDYANNNYYIPSDSVNSGNDANYVNEENKEKEESSLGDLFPNRQETNLGDSFPESEESSPVVSFPEDDVVDASPDLEWSGSQYCILGRNYESNMFKNFEVDRDELPVDIVGITVWIRNKSMMDKYGIDVVGTLTNDPYETARVTLEAGDDVYDLVLVPSAKMQTLAMLGYLLDIKTLEHVDLENDCWNDYANTQLTVGGKLYYTTSKFLLQDKHRLGVAFYNRDLAQDLKIGKLENNVFDGTWTMDKLVEIAKVGSADKDGVEGMSMNDMWGVTAESSLAFNRLAYGVGFKISENGTDGYPKLIGVTDRMLSCLDKVFELTADKNTCYIYSLRDVDDKPSGLNADSAIFFGGDSVVHLDCLSAIDNMNELSFTYGIIPMPKYDAYQADYYSLPDVTNGTLMAVPATVYDTAKAGFGLQKISEEAVNTSYNAYIETKCKLRNYEEGAKSLDIIFAGVVYDVAFIANIGGIRQIMSELVVGGTNNYTRYFKKIEKKANNEIVKLKEAYAKFE